MMTRNPRLMLWTPLLLVITAAGCAAGPDESEDGGGDEEAAEVVQQPLPWNGGYPDEDEPQQPVDADGDGYASIATGGDDCNDNSKHVHPGAADVCDDGKDMDCDGYDCKYNGICLSLLVCNKAAP